MIELFDREKAWCPIRWIGRLSKGQDESKNELDVTSRQRRGGPKNENFQKSWKLLVTEGAGATGVGHWDCTPPHPSAHV